MPSFSHLGDVKKQLLYGNLLQLPARDIGGSVTAAANNFIGMKGGPGYRSYATPALCIADVMGWFLRTTTGNHGNYKGKEITQLGKLLDIYCPGADQNYKDMLRNGTGLTLDQHLKPGSKEAIMSVCATVLAKESGGCKYRF